MTETDEHTAASQSENASGPSFDNLGIRAEVLAALADLEYKVPSPIQSQAIPLFLDGQDLVGLAQTGTGKTAAFALPILSKIDENSKKTQALVLAPTRELALQVADTFAAYAAYLPKISILPIYGGQNYAVQLSGLRKGAQIVVGTPGRVIDHLERGTLDLSELDFLVLDEADEMLTMGFQEDVERILRDTPEYKQVALFSATMPPAISKLSKKYLDDPIEIAVKAKTTTSAAITQRYIVVPNNQKFEALTRYLEVEQTDGVIVFVRTKQATEELAQQLQARHFAAAAINGDMVQTQRERTINQLKEGSIDILIATDVAARGLDVERISLVINYDIPRDTESYVHRIGRTGRAGREGDALLFVTPREKTMLKAIERATRQPLAEIPMPSAQEVNERRVAKFSDGITQNLTHKSLEVFKNLITQYAQEYDKDPFDIAAALAVQAIDAENFLLPPDTKKAARFVNDDDDRGSYGGYNDKNNGKNREFSPYRIDAGSKHNVTARQIVGTLANLGRLRRSDFGHISIKPEFSIVELSSNLDKNTIQALRSLRINGIALNLRPDPGKHNKSKGKSYDNDRNNDRNYDRNGDRYNDRNGDRRKSKYRTQHEVWSKD